MRRKKWGKTGFYLFDGLYKKSVIKNSYINHQGFSVTLEESKINSH